MPHSEIVKLLLDNELNVSEERFVYEFVKDYLKFRSECPDKE